ncbi:MAG TPA: DUF4344 domain-containing metallopeptidase, partial [Blastocatellia bacterium]|nr:DUF4344 domain-containing metallopeptidase [Blastocatellia bacterium]
MALKSNNLIKACCVSAAAVMIIISGSSLALGVRGGAGGGPKARYDSAAAVVPIVVVQARKGGKIKDAGDFKVVYKSTKKYAEMEAIIKDSKMFDEVAAGLNETFALPIDLPIVFTECGEENAYYDPDKGEIRMCYELLQQFLEMFAKELKDSDRAGEAFAGATAFVFFHELGHALIHIYELPVTGKEEDAVDQLATLVLTSAGDIGEKAALDGASSFVLAEDHKNLKAGDLPFWDEHSLGEQRFYGILCWVYGEDEKKFASLVKNGSLPKERAERCAEEYQQLSRSWNKLLDPYLKEEDFGQKRTRSGSAAAKIVNLRVGA